MCQPASFVLTKDAIFWSKKTDSHESIIEEFGLHADGARGANIVRVEIVPAGNDFRLPIEQWAYKLDQDVKPKWYDAEECEARVRAVLPDWICAKVILPGVDAGEIRDRQIIACYGSVTAYGSSSVTAYGSSSVTACGSSSVRAYDSSSVREINDGAVVTAYHAIPADILHGDRAVLIDRSNGIPVVHVGAKQEG